MLDFSQTRLRSSTSRKTGTPFLVNEEGLALVADTNVQDGVTVSTGAAGEQFVGLSITTQLDPVSVPQVVEVVVGANGQFKLPAVPYTGAALFVKNQTSNAALTAVAAGATPTAAQYAPTDDAQVFATAAASAGNIILVAYRVAATVELVRWIQGDQLPGHNVAATLNTVGVFTSGDIRTSCFDTGADWTAAALYVKLGPNGLFTATTNIAEAIPGVRVLSRPSTGSAWLGLSVGFNG